MTAPDLDSIARDVEDLIVAYLAELAALLTAPATHVVGDSGHVRSKVIGSPAPWNDEAASLLFEIHAGTRRDEAHLRHALAFNPIRRGTSDLQTIASLSALPALTAAITTRHLPTAPVDRTRRDLARWTRLARRILDHDPLAHERPHTKAPGGLTCPYCNRRLVLKHGWQHRPDLADLYCLRCPTTIDEDHPHGRDLTWPADAWLAVLQQDQA